VLDRDNTDVASLNSNTGVRLNTNLALTSLGEIAPLVGRISGNAVSPSRTWEATRHQPRRDAVQVEHQRSGQQHRR